MRMPTFAEALNLGTRAQRRANKHPFRWLTPAQQTGEAITPRYIRRHGERVLRTGGLNVTGPTNTAKPRTRRERKEAARVARLMA